MKRKKKDEDRVYLKRYGFIDRDIIVNNSDLHFQYVNEQIFSGLTFLDRCIFTVLLTCIDWKDQIPLTIAVPNKYIFNKLGCKFNDSQKDKMELYVRETLYHFVQQDAIDFYNYDDKKWQSKKFIVSASGNSLTTEIIFNSCFLSHFKQLCKRVVIERQKFSTLIALNTISSRTTDGLRLEKELKAFSGRADPFNKCKVVFSIAEIKNLINSKGFDYIKDLQKLEEELVKVLEDINENSMLIKILNNNDGMLLEKVEEDYNVVGYELRWKIENLRNVKKKIETQINLDIRKLDSNAKDENAWDKDIVEIEADYSDWFDECQKSSDLYAHATKNNISNKQSPFKILQGEEDLNAIQYFCKKWKNKGQEDADDHLFWIDILNYILGVSNATDRIKFQKKTIVDGHTKKIDAYIPETRVLIEQKSCDVLLNKKMLQSDGVWLTPYEQAFRYNSNLRFSERARWIITSNFKEIWIYDMEEMRPEKNVKKIYLSDLVENPHLLDFLLLNTNDEPHHA